MDKSESLKSFSMVWMLQNTPILCITSISVHYKGIARAILYLALQNMIESESPSMLQQLLTSTLQKRSSSLVSPLIQQKGCSLKPRQWLQFRLDRKKGCPLLCRRALATYCLCELFLQLPQSGQNPDQSWMVKRVKRGRLIAAVAHLRGSATQSSSKTSADKIAGLKVLPLLSCFLFISRDCVKLLFCAERRFQGDLKKKP